MAGAEQRSDSRFQPSGHRQLSFVQRRAASSCRGRQGGPTANFPRENRKRDIRPSPRGDPQGPPGTGVPIARRGAPYLRQRRTRKQIGRATQWSGAVRVEGRCEELREAGPRAKDASRQRLCPTPRGAAERIELTSRSYCRWICCSGFSPRPRRQMRCAMRTSMRSRCLGWLLHGLSKRYARLLLCELHSLRHSALNGEFPRQPLRLLHSRLTSQWRGRASSHPLRRSRAA